MNLKTVGYYKEMPHGKDSDPSIFDFVGLGDVTLIDNVCKYLKSGIALIVSPGMAYDVIDPQLGESGSPSAVTDGYWLWPEDLIYYVKKYKVKLPEEFLRHMTNSNWKVTVCPDELDFNTIEIDGQTVMEP